VSAALLVHRLGNGLFELGSTGLVLGDQGSGTAPDIWRHADALLVCSTNLHPSLHGEWHAWQALAAKHSGNGALWEPASHPGATWAAGLGTFCDKACVGDGPLQRLMWLPVEDSKHDRGSLKASLDRALAFISSHVGARRCVAVVDFCGGDAAVCVVVAALLACFAPPPPGSSETPAFVGAWGDAACPHQSVTKQSVRQQLAWVSAMCPNARPTRGMLKQVFNFFEERRRGSVAAHAL